MNHYTLKSIIAKHKILWGNKFFTKSTVIGFFLFIISLFVNYSAIKYAAINAGNSVTDTLLGILPVVNTDIIFSEGTLLFIIFIIFLFILEPKTIPFTLKSVALFILVRSAFVVMTHLGPIPSSIATDLSNFRYISSGSDLFFSGHTGLPFLMALLFWSNKYLRLLFISFSIIAATAVILGHLHYTIDVFSAFFITYGVYHITQNIFRKDCTLFARGIDVDNSI